MAHVVELLLHLIDVSLNALLAKLEFVDLSKALVDLSAEVFYHFFDQLHVVHHDTELSLDGFFGLKL